MIGTTRSMYGSITHRTIGGVSYDCVATTDDATKLIEALRSCTSLRVAR